VSVPDASKLRLLGMLGDHEGRPLRLRSFALPPPPPRTHGMKVIVVCGSSMNAGKTHAASTLISGLQHNGERVAGIKLTGTAAGRDTWSMLDAGACVALDFVDGGYPSTYLLGLGDLLELHAHLLGHAAAAGATSAVVEIADGLLQFETAALLGARAFTETVDAWLFAAADPLSAVSGVRLLAGWGILPAGITGCVTMSPLGMIEVKRATGLPCFRTADLQAAPIDDLFGHVPANFDLRARAHAGAA
jgi:hypothetical protein